MTIELGIICSLNSACLTWGIEQSQIIVRIVWCGTYLKINGNQVKKNEKINKLMLNL